MEKDFSARPWSKKLIDCDHKTPKAVEEGVPYIGIPQMDNSRINFDANPKELISRKISSNGLEKLTLNTAMLSYLEDVILEKLSMFQRI